MPTPAASSPAALLDARLQEFNLLPSRSLHAERARALAEAHAERRALTSKNSRPEDWRSRIIWRS